MIFANCDHKPQKSVLLGVRRSGVLGAGHRKWMVKSQITPPRVDITKEGIVASRRCLSEFDVLQDLASATRLTSPKLFYNCRPKNFTTKVQAYTQHLLEMSCDVREDQAEACAKVVGLFGRGSGSPSRAPRLGRLWSLEQASG